ncbi:hypothetical protein [Salinadaptatus halalkaliphilus]|uniref:hypothetical protein n=1 Tax=Salinadaptatus halalkaliphilus TaxID=2419781 RepID=UPI0011419080|nr:hypothetical protein [Salinadaptatus halalkaliphilus]
MDTAGYIERIDEQLRAYEFQSTDYTPVPDVYSRETNRLASTGTHYEVVIVDHVDEPVVDEIEAELKTARDIYDGLSINSTSRFDSERVYLLIVAEEVTKPMQIRAERAAGEVLNGDTFLLPVLVDLSGSRLLYDEPSTLKRVTTHGKMVSNVEKYFRL